MNSRRILPCICLLLIITASVAVRADAPGKPTARTKAPDAAAVKGRLTEIEGIPVLRVWGSPQERGYAQGYLLADEIRGILTGYLAETRFSGGPARFEATAETLSATMNIPPQYMDELRGMLAGMEARLKGETAVPGLNRNLKLTDLVAINCVPDYVGFGCSAFAAWGNLTRDGKTLAGRNLDWHAIDALRDSQIIIAHIPDVTSDKRAWLSITWPGLIGCLTGMNAEGVTVSMHDVPAGMPEGVTGLTPRGIILREAIESAGAGTAKSDITKVLQIRRCLVGNNISVSMPYDGKRPPSLIFEYDGFVDQGGGVTIRRPASRTKHSGNGGYQVATNHYCKRSEPRECSRYQTLEKRLKSIRKKSRKKKKGRLTPKRAWSLLRDVDVSDKIITYHSVVFEPNAMRMHVAFTKDGKPAPACKHVTLDVEQLLSPADSKPKP